MYLKEKKIKVNQLKWHRNIYETYFKQGFEFFADLSEFLPTGYYNLNLQYFNSKNQYGVMDHPCIKSSNIYSDIIRIITQEK